MLQYVLPISDTARELGYDILMVTEPDGGAALKRIASSGMVNGRAAASIRQSGRYAQRPADRP